jgi:putative two-component system response regulator
MICSGSYGFLPDWYYLQGYQVSLQFTQFLLYCHINFMEKILLVEDDNVLREAAHEVLSGEGYKVTSVGNGMDALDALNDLIPDLIVSDISMPKMDGFALLDAVRSSESGMTIPFLFISANADRRSVSQARHLGVDDYLFKPFELMELLDAVRVRLDRRRTVLLFDTREAHLQTVNMLANAIEARDAYTRGHVDRVREYALALGSSLGWSKEQLTVLEFGAILHDIGKIVVPEDILNKKDFFTSDEKAVIRHHVEAGAQMLTGITHLQAVIPYVLYHHERWDGSGYPHGLAAEGIPLEGRLLAIVDAFDAMTSQRPYRTAMSKEEALEEIRQKRGIDFDPLLVHAFLRLMGTFS